MLPCSAKPAAPAKKKVDKFAAKLAARAEEALKKQAEDEAKLAALKAQVVSQSASQRDSMFTLCEQMT